jgi:hypothetical protein
MASSLDWKFTVTLPELARILDLPEADARRVGADCRVASVETYSVDAVARKFHLDDVKLLEFFRSLR